MIDIDFFRCDNHLVFDKKLVNQHINLLKQVKNLKNKVNIQKEKIKSLSHQINLLNRAIWRYKNGKN